MRDVTGDLVFLGGVVLLNWFAQYCVFDRFTLHGSAQITFVVLEWTFCIATVVPVISFVAFDSYIALMRPWRKEAGPSQQVPQLRSHES
jgi:hypothetical protein